MTKLLLPTAILAMTFAAGCVATTPGAVSRQGVPKEVEENMTTSARLALLGQVIELLQKNYVGDDPRLAERMLNGAFKGALLELDPYSIYEPPAVAKKTLAQLDGSSVGVGINIVKKDGRSLQIIGVIPGSPAAKAGLLPGDTVVELNGRRTAPLNFGECRNFLSGVAGSKVKMQVRRQKDNSTVDLELPREAITVPSIQPQTLRLLPDGVGYMRLDMFNGSTAATFDKSLAELRTKGNLRGLIIDLRNNPGGVVDAAVAVASRLLAPGKTVFTAGGRVSDPTGNVTLKSGEFDPDLPVVILVNKFSASAAEILAGALQAHKRAKIVGTTTFGKGSIQRRQPLPGGGAIRYTVAYYQTPSGRVINNQGLRPDVVIPLSDREIYQLAVQSAAHPGEIDPGKKDTIRDVQLQKAWELLSDPGVEKKGDDKR